MRVSIDEVTYCFFSVLGDCCVTIKSRTACSVFWLSVTLSKVEICPEMHVNKIHLPHDRHHKVSSLMKFHKNTQNYVKYEVYENV